MHIRFSFFISVFLFISTSINSQDLLALLDSIDDSGEKTIYIEGTFKATRLINGYTSEIAPEKELVFSISHRFGQVNDGGQCYVPSEVITIPPDLTTGIEQESVFGTIKIYPNPTPGLFTIEIENNLYGELMIDINNEAGVRILMMEILKNHRHFKTVVDLRGQGKGLYFIGFKFEKDYTVRKLIIE
ncbi:DUF5777 family beta-barrel protein [Bacteroidota bacterium]